MNNSNYQVPVRTTRLGKTEYTGPATTITESLQHAGAYKDKLKGYNCVEHIDSVNDNTHVRYFVWSVANNKWMFRTGGFLKRRHPKYVVLSNGQHTWSVQREIKVPNSDDVYETKFFKIMSKRELSDIALEAQQQEIDKLRSENSALRQYAGFK